MKRVLLDQNVPRKLVSRLTSHRAETAASHGWSSLANGKMIMAAETHRFDILPTADQNPQYKQNLAMRRIAIIVLDINGWRRIEARLPLVLAAIEMAGIESFQPVGCFDPDLG